MSTVFFAYCYSKNMGKKILMALLLVLSMSGLVMAQQSINDSDFAFGKFKMMEPFNKDNAEAVYGKYKILKLSKEEMKTLGNAIDDDIQEENEFYNKECIVYIFDTAIFFTQENILLAALSTCEKGSSPRNLQPPCDTSDVIKIFGKPIDIDSSDDDLGQTLTYCGINDTDKPHFAIIVSNEENSLGRKKFSVIWGRTQSFSMVCLVVHSIGSDLLLQLLDRYVTQNSQ